MIADPLQVVGDFRGGHQQPQVARHRLLCGEQPDDLVLDLELQRVDGAVARDDQGRLSGVAMQQRLDRVGQGRLRLRGQGEERRLQLRQLVVEMAVGLGGGRVHPNRPVI